MNGLQSRREFVARSTGCVLCLPTSSSLLNAIMGKEPVAVSEIFKNDAPTGQLWLDWQKHKWLVEARFVTRVGKNFKCNLCPNGCVLTPGDRGRCRVRVSKGDRMWSLAYANPCSINVDPIEKKPLYHFLPKTQVFSLATAGCGFRCLNCQNWEISQVRPEEVKKPRGEPLRLNPKLKKPVGRRDLDKVSLFPEDAVAMAGAQGCRSIAYTYSEPSVWFEYMYDTALRAKKQGVRNVWVTCGYLREKPLELLSTVMDAANVDLKSYDKDLYKKLNAGKLDAVLATLKTLKQKGVWFEMTNLIVPTYTDKPEMIKRMCGWIVKNLGADYPLHFSRFHPAHKLTHLPPTPSAVLLKARDIARSEGLHYVYIGNAQEIADGGNTWCPSCKRLIIERRGYRVGASHLKNGKCRFCGASIAGVW